MKIFSAYPGCHKDQIAPSEFSEVLTRAGCGGTIYLGIMIEVYHTFNISIILHKVLFYSLINLLH